MKIEGLDDVTKYLNTELKKIVDKSVQETITKVADELVEEMKTLAPVDSGRLRNSIKWEQVKKEVEVTVGVSYGYFVEFGTMDTPAQSFFYPSVDQFRNRIGELLTQELEKRL